MKLALSFLLAVSLFSLNAYVQAAPTKALGDLSQPIHIQSDKASFEHALQLATHEGNVVLTQGTHELLADKVVFKKETKNEQNVIIATGNPARFKGLMLNDPSPVIATANTIKFYPDKHLILFEGNATLNHEQDNFKGPSLSYQMDKQVITAAANTHERPSIVIQPRRAK